MAMYTRHPVEGISGIVFVGIISDLGRKREQPVGGVGPGSGA